MVEPNARISRRIRLRGLLRKTLHLQGFPIRGLKSPRITRHQAFPYEGRDSRGALTAILLLCGIRAATAPIGHDLTVVCLQRS